MNEDMQTKKMYAKRTGIAGETLCHSQGALSEMSAGPPVGRVPGHSRIYKEKNCRDNNEYASCNIDRSIPRVLESTSQEENRVALEVFMISGSRLSWYGRWLRDG